MGRECCAESVLGRFWTLQNSRCVGRLWLDGWMVYSDDTSIDNLTIRVTKDIHTLFIFV
jgi:hypothetical protein